MVSLSESLSPATPDTDLDLIRKYSGSAPRYTSYPPATQFTNDIASIRIEDAIAEDNATDDRPLSLYVHLPFCESQCWYCGCNTVITREKSAADRYLDDLAREIALYNLQLNDRRRVTQLHLGGGTPTFLTAVQIDRLREILYCYFTFAPDAEISVEIDPRRLSLEQVGALYRLGARRASLGIQDTDRRVQLAIHRHQPHALNQQAFAWLRAAGFTSINVDLIYGLPLQTEVSFARTLDSVLGLGPDRLSVFGYAHVPWIKPAQTVFERREQLPDVETRLNLWQLAHQRLTGAGYIDIGLDHFARPGDELALAQREGTLHRNFQGYSTRAGASVYAFGMSAISSIGGVYFQNSRSLTDYHAALQSGQLPIKKGLRLTAEDEQRRTIIMRLMCDRLLDFERLSIDLGTNFRESYGAELASLADLAIDGAIELSERRLRVTPLGMPLLRVIAQRFDAYVARGTGQNSQAV